MAKKTEKPVDYSKPLKNAKYERFCQEYVIDNNGTQAAIRAKYSEKTANVKGAQLLAIVNIRSRVDFLQRDLSERNGISADMVIKELAKIGFSNIKGFLADGNEITDISQLPDDVAAAVESIQCDVRHDGGESEGYTEKVKVRLHSKLGALNDLGRHLGIFEKDNEQSKALSITDIAALMGGKSGK